MTLVMLFWRRGGATSESWGCSCCSDIATTSLSRSLSIISRDRQPDHIGEVERIKIEAADSGGSPFELAIITVGTQGYRVSQLVGACW